MANSALALSIIASLLLASTLAAASPANRKLLSSQSATSRGRNHDQFQNRAANTLRASVQTSQFIQQSVDNGASLGSVQRAGVTGSALAWAAGQKQQTFNAVEQATAPNAFTG